MSIRDRLQDATLLWQNGQREGALLSVLVAIAATSRKRYPEGKYGDRKAFTSFLSDEMFRLTRMVNWIPTAEWTVTYQGKKMECEEFLYEYLRCELAHEAKVPPDIVFGQSPIPVAIFPQNSTLLIDHSLIVALSEVVLEVSENDNEFPLPAQDYIDFEI